MATKPLWEHIIFVTLCISCIILNLTEIVLIIKKRRSIKTFELILLSLAVADLIKGLSDSVYAVYDITQGISITFNKGPFQYLIFTMQFFAVCSSITHILGISVKRVLAVTFPFKHRRHSSLQAAKRFIAIIWIVAIILTVATAFPSWIVRVRGSSSDSFISLYVLAGLIIFFRIIFVGIYSYIIWIVIIRSRQFNQRFYGGTQGQTVDLHKHAKSSRESFGFYFFVGCNDIHRAHISRSGYWHLCCCQSHRQSGILDQFNFFLDSGTSAY